MIEINTAKNSAFSNTLPFMQLAWDATSLSSARKCARHYYYKNIIGLTTLDRALPLEFGIQFHDGLDTYHNALHQATITGEDKLNAHHTAQHEMVRAVMIATGIYEVDEITGVKIHLSNWTTDNTYLNRHTLIRNLIQWTEEYRTNPTKVITLPGGKLATELSFRFSAQFATHQDEPIILCGHMDQLVSFNGSIWALDHKTTKASLGAFYWRRFNPNPQVSLYTIAGSIIQPTQIAGLIIDAICCQVKEAKFQRLLIQKTQEELDEFYNGVIHTVNYYNTLAELAMDSPEPENIYIQNDVACTFCDYHELCTRPRSRRELLMNQLYSIDQWDPLIVR